LSPKPPLAADLEDLVTGAPAKVLSAQVEGLRRRLARDIGLVMPTVEARVQRTLAEGSYQILLDGAPVASGLAPPNKLMVIPDVDLTLSPEIATPEIEPIFGLTAFWVPIELPAEMADIPHTVVTRQQAIVSHLNEVVRRNPGRLLTRQAVRQMVDLLQSEHPALVEEIDVGVLPLATLHAVLQILLDDGNSIRNLRMLLERMTSAQAELVSFEQLLASARSAVQPLNLS
ncbi:MAG: FHIPEP family type III secretion protein, partial [Acidimicrobiales bacterium]